MDGPATRLTIGIVEESVELTDDIFRLSVRAPEASRDVSAGQFYMIRGWEGNNPLLRRPFSISDIIGEHLCFLVRVTGWGTKLISGLKKGDRLSLLGPLGSGFTLQKGVRKHLFVAGGVGIAPFPLLGKKLRAFDPSGEIELLYGERSAARMVDPSLLALEGMKVSVTTEDGSAGKKGLLTHLLSARLAATKGSLAMYVCGPWGMLREVKSQADGHPATVQFSLESFMGCGVGCCMGCVVEVMRDGIRSYRRVCHDGPVFNGREVVF